MNEETVMTPALSDALEELKRAVEFKNNVRAAARRGEEVTATGAWRDALDWIQSAADQVVLATSES